MNHSRTVLEAPVGTVNRSFVTQAGQVVNIDDRAIFSVEKIPGGGVQVKPLLKGEPIGFCDHFCRPIAKPVKVVGEEGEQFFVARAGSPILRISIVPMPSGRVRLLYSNRQDRLVPARVGN